MDVFLLVEIRELLTTGIETPTFVDRMEGHVFEDDNTFEYPHYHGPNGEHISYIPNE